MGPGPEGLRRQMCSRARVCAAVRVCARVFCICLCMREGVSVRSERWPTTPWWEWGADSCKRQSGRHATWQGGLHYSTRPPALMFVCAHTRSQTYPKYPPTRSPPTPTHTHAHALFPALPLKPCCPTPALTPSCAAAAGRPAVRRTRLPRWRTLAAASTLGTTSRRPTSWWAGWVAQ